MILSWRSFLKKYFPDFAFLFLIALSVVVLDQLSKSYVRNSVPIGEMWAPWSWLLPYARIVHWTNTGAAFGMFQRFGGIFTILAIIVSGVILYYFPQIPREDWPLRLALGLQLGGAIGNLVDRLRFGTVTDFISVGSFAVFNVADAAISLGVAILVLDLLYKDWQKRKLDKQAKDSATLKGEDPAGGAENISSTPPGKE